MNKTYKMLIILFFIAILSLCLNKSVSANTSTYFENLEIMHNNNPITVNGTEITIEQGDSITIKFYFNASAEYVQRIETKGEKKEVSKGGQYNYEIIYNSIQEDTIKIIVDKINLNSFTMYTIKSECFLELKVKVIPKLPKEVIEMENDYEEKQNDLETAKDSPPDINATPEEIKRYIESLRYGAEQYSGEKAEYWKNNFENLFPRDGEVVKKWMDTIKHELDVENGNGDVISRQLYSQSYFVLDSYIRGDLNYYEYSNAMLDKKEAELRALENSIEKMKKEFLIKYGVADLGEERKKVTFVDVIDDVQGGFTNYKIEDMSGDEAKKIEEVTTNLLSIITSIGMIITVIVPAVLGIKYMLGSVEERAEYKNDLIPYIIGAVLLFGICTVVKILLAFADNIKNAI